MAVGSGVVVLVTGEIYLHQVWRLRFGVDAIGAGL